MERGKLHNHTVCSLNDGAQTHIQLVDRAIEIGAPAIALTNHGNMMDAIDFMEYCKEKNIKPIVGFEGYVQDKKEEHTTGNEEIDNNNSMYTDDVIKRGHACFYAVDWEGFKILRKLCTDGYKNLDSSGFPIITTDMIKKYVGQGKKGHGKIIMTTACVGGVIAQYLIHNASIDDKINTVMSKIAENSDVDKIETIIKEYNDMQAEINAVKAKKDALKSVATRTFKKEEVAAKSLPDNERENILKDIAKNKAETKNAKEKVRELNAIEREKRENLKLIKERMDECKKEISLYNRNVNLIEKYKSGYKDENTMKKFAKKRLIELANIVGKDNLYVELQYHGLKKEAIAMPIMAQMAKELGLNMCCANDAHYDIKSQDNVDKRQMLMSLRFNKWSEIEPDASEYYVKTDAEIEESLSKILDKETIELAFEGVDKLVNRVNVEIDIKTHYPKFINHENPSESAHDYLVRKCNEGIKELFADGTFTEKYQKQLAYELDVIHEMGFDDYIAIVQDYVCNFGRKKLNSDVIYSVGSARGSAAGSLVCYTSGITACIDPIKYNLLFERFLNPDRVTMPDIDVDMDPIYRADFIKYVKDKYGDNAVCQISTKMLLKPKAAIKAAARIIMTKYYVGNKVEDDKTKKTWQGIANILAKEISFGMSSFDDLVDPEDAASENIYEKICNKYEGNKKALEVIHSAKLIAGCPSSYSKHAAGIVISDNDDVSDYMALIDANGDGALATQCSMTQVEEWGLLKMDFLGLRNLRIITDARKLIKEEKGITFDIDKVPFEAEVFSEIFAKANTNGVFQFEGNGMKDMLRKFQPTCFEDIIAAISVYRPGPIKYVPTLVAVKHGREKMTFEIEELRPILAQTYGVPLYQEQIMQIFQILAGYSFGQADLVRRAMSKKKITKLLHEREAFLYGDAERNIEGCKARNIDVSAAEKLFDEMIDFAKYAFNKSHAAAYAFIAYQTAWIKYHYPIEFMCALLMNSSKKEAMFTSECRSLGIEVVGPDINKAKENWSIYNGKIMMGFSNIKKLKSSASEIIEARKKNNGFVSFDDYIANGITTKAVMEGLIYCGVFDEFGSRKGISTIYEEKGKAFKEAEESTKALKDITDEKLLEKKQFDVKAAMDKFNSITIPNLPNEDKYEKELEYAGFYITGHPIDNYGSTEEYGCKNIGSLTTGYNKIYGIITKVNEITTKKGDKMCFATIDDNTGTNEIVVFPKTYAKCCDYLLEGKAVMITGKTELKDSDNDEDDDANDDTISEVDNLAVVDNKKYQTIADEISLLKKKTPRVIIHVNSIVDWFYDICDIIKIYEDNDGSNFLVHDRTLGELRNGLFKVNLNSLMAVETDKFSVTMENDTMFK